MMMCSCDTFVVLPCASSDGSTLFAKNSDRDPNEAQEIMHCKEEDYTEGTTVKCTYIEIPQAEHTHEILIVKPHWIWGAEMGVNSQGVAIGNEAIQSRVPISSVPSLIGMDIVRLALERANNAEHAVTTITSLLETYGQGGCCGFQRPFSYHNAFMVADKFGDVWIINTINRDWVARRITAESLRLSSTNITLKSSTASSFEVDSFSKDTEPTREECEKLGIASISNVLHSSSSWDLFSKDIVKKAQERGWCSSDSDFHFHDCYRENIFSFFGEGKKREKRSRSLLFQQRGNINVASVMDILKDHFDVDDYNPSKGIMGQNLCMHAGWGPIRRSQTTASSIFVLSPRGNKPHWIASTASPCLSVYLPYWMGSFSNVGNKPKAKYTKGSLWWEHEIFHRIVLLDYQHRFLLAYPILDELQKKFYAKAEEGEEASPSGRQSIMQSCFDTYMSSIPKLIDSVNKKTQVVRPRMLYTLAWRANNLTAGLDHSSLVRPYSSIISDVWYYFHEVIYVSIIVLLVVLYFWPTSISSSH
eukprot:TRINITY_DN4369_c0_g1_i2.p1 TRINITY_DN4369_c0_g1~~TRINITY_DN4369_c0_g1_i2.p1  ORF type:complete len:531 (-),score=125.16 TRINITY_DN4369_c0_g1_i2:16-1608(-)